MQWAEMSASLQEDELTVVLSARVTTWYSAVDNSLGEKSRRELS